MSTKPVLLPWRIAPSIELDPRLNEERKRRAAYRLNVILNPLYRLIGFWFIGLAILLHNRFLAPAGVSPSTVILLFGSYPIVAWAVMLAGYRRFPFLSNVLLVVDTLFLLLTIYFTGGEKSLLFIVPLFRVVDQTHTSFRRAMFFGHLTMAGYFALLAWLAFGDGRQLVWQAEAVKALLLYGGILYTALTARAADAVKTRTSEAITLARESFSSLHEAGEERERLMDRLDLVLQSAGDGIVGFDIDGRVTFANRRAAKTVGLEPADLIGRKGHTLAVHCTEGAKVCDGSDCPLEAALHSGREERGENAGFFRKDGTVVPVAYTSAPMYEDDKLTGAVFSFRDITATKRLEADLREARDAAEQASRAKSLFLANMSHELRTPLNAIIGYSEMLEEELRDDGNTALAGDAVKIQVAGKRLLAMITDILDIAKVEAGRIKAVREPVEIAPLLQDLAMTLAPRFSSRGNRLEIAPATDARQVESDPAMLRRVLTALLDNANKFSSSATTRLAVSSGDAGVTFHVIDQGVGLSEEQVKTLFEPFSPGSAAATKTAEGTGIGLALSKRLASAIGATLHVRSTQGAGSEFMLSVPASASVREESS